MYNYNYNPGFSRFQFPFSRFHIPGFKDRQHPMLFTIPSYAKKYKTSGIILKAISRIVNRTGEWGTVRAITKKGNGMGMELEWNGNGIRME